MLYITGVLLIMKGFSMYIIKSESKITGIILYFTGIVVETAPNKYHIHPEWNVSSQFATMFSTKELADRVAVTFQSIESTVLFTAIDEREL